MAEAPVLTLASRTAVPAPTFPRPRRGVRLVALVLGPLVALLFVAYQYRTAFSLADRFGDAQDLRFMVAFFVVPYLTVTGAGVIAAVAGRGRLALLPPLTYAVLGWGSSASYSEGILGTWSASTGTARAISLSMALVPCACAAILARRRPSNATSTLAVVVSFTFVGGAVALAVVLRAVIAGVAWDRSIDLVAVAVLAGLGVSGRLMWLPGALIVGASLSPDVLSWTAAGVLESPPTQELVFYTLLVLLAAGQRRVAVFVDRMRRHPWRVFVAINALNVADAVATFVAVRSGNASEANPVVDVIGLPAKMIVGLVASHLIARHRPEALLFPVMVLALVLAWHVAGFFI